MLKFKLISESVKVTRDFSFAPFKQMRGDGDNGPLLIATRKNKASERYIIKHYHPECAANEFVYSCIAQALDVKTPEIVLFKLTEKTNQILSTDYIMGSKIIDIAVHNPTIEQIRATSNWQDYFRFIALRGMLAEGDSFETPITTSNDVYRIDTSDSFGIPILGGMRNLIQMTCHPQFRDFAKGIFDSMNYDSLREKDDYLRGKRICEKEGGVESVSIYLDTFARFIEIPEAYIDSVINTLGTIYPDCICNHYKKYIVGVQKQATKFLKEQS